MNDQHWTHLFRSPIGAALSASLFFLGLTMACSASLISLLVSQVDGLNKLELTAFFATTILGSLTMAMIAAPLSDGKVPGWVLVLVSGLIAAVGLAGIVRPAVGWTVYLFGFLSSSGTIVLFPQLFAMASTRVFRGWSTGAKGVGSSVLRTLFSLGFVAGTTVAAVLVRYWGLDTIFYSLSLFGVFATLFSSVVVYRAARQPAEAPAHKDGGATNPLSVWVILGSLAAVTLLQGADRTRTSYLPLLMFDQFQDASIAPLMMGTSAILELATLSLAAWIALKIGSRLTIFWGAILGAGYFLAFVFHPPLMVLYGVNLTYSLYAAALQGVALSYVQGLIAHRPGFGGSLYLVSSNFGALGALALQLVLPGYGPMSFLLPMLLCVVAAVLLLRRTET